MRKIFLLCLLVPIIGMSQNNVVSTFRAFPKTDRLLEFEKALASHAQKYHTGDWKWRVFYIETGPDAGGYHITEGPLSWEQFDKRGDLSAEHTLDWAKNVSPHTSERGTTGYSVYSTELSNVAITDYSDKIIITHMFVKPGMIREANDLVRKLKKAWVASNESVAVYNVSLSGPPQIVTVNRLKQGLKELSPGFRKPMAERFDEVHGAGAWNYYLADYAKAIESRWSEMLSLRADLGSK
ncbi:hypothetical protein [Lacibacter sediminis]|uniref:NIPSNAP family protein n=1 Tax=Lacibacter sediminis TaxID=2760713 RepID=A0A7G5XLK3_9BACT|nr:hypothetical protein [Lacibacter sediminis]QNA46356.1 hypothetical protein H4075_09345 [Lacibacter sediminis]